MARRAKRNAVQLLPSAALPTIETAAELVARAMDAHRARRHHLATTYLEASLGILQRLRKGVEAARAPGIDRTTTGVRRALVRALKDLEPHRFGLVSIERVREAMQARHEVGAALVDVTLRDLERRCVLALSLRGAESEHGLWINGRGWMTHVCRARAYWPDAGRPYDD